MLKYVLLAGAMTIAAPALAQTQPAPSDPVPVTDAQPAPTAKTPAKVSPAAPVQAPAAPATTAATTPAQDATTPGTAPATDGKVAQAAPSEAQGETAVATAPADAAAAAPADKATQVADVVNSEFPIYDKDSSGSLNRAEFGSWMVALKTASDPATKPESPAVRTWIGQAFASADTDKSKSVSKTELEGFLSKGG